MSQAEINNLKSIVEAAKAQAKESDKALALRAIAW